MKCVANHMRCFVVMILVIISFAFLCGCVSPPSDEKTVAGTGIVIYIDLEGGFYGLEADDGTQYYPLNLGEEYQVDGLSVGFTGTIREDVATIAQWGIPIELTSIQSLEDRNGEGHFTIEESRSIAKDHVKSMDEYAQYGGTNLRLTGTETLRCPYCWQFTYDYDRLSMKDPNVIDHVVTKVTVEDGDVTEISQSAGLPGDIMTVGKLMADSLYETTVDLVGRVSLLGQLNCPCFNLTSGGESVEVWYDMMVEDDKTELPAVSVEGIGNGDIVLVKGMLKDSGTYHQKGVFWAENVIKYP